MVLGLSFARLITLLLVVSIKKERERATQGEDTFCQLQASHAGVHCAESKISQPPFVLFCCEQLPQV